MSRFSVSVALICQAMSDQFFQPFPGDNLMVPAAVLPLVQNGVQRVRPVIQVTLCQFTTDLDQEFPLFFRFHAFRQRMDSELPADPNNGLQDFPVGTFMVIQILQQFHIHFNQVCFEFAE